MGETEIGGRRFKLVPPANDANCCSFCGKMSTDVFTLIRGAMAMICDECVDLSASLVAKKRETNHA